MTSCSSRYSRRGEAGGFTLVELAVVLVVLAVIGGIVVTAVGARQSADYARIKQKFVDQWARAYNEFYQRAGVVIGDDPTAPTFAVNAAADAAVAAEFLAVTNNDYSGVTPPPRLCQSDTRNESHNEPYEDAEAAGGRATAASVNLHNLLDDLGIRMPKGRAEGREDRYAYLDRAGNAHELQICFQWNPPGTDWGAGNVMVLAGLTPDLARALDQAIDGTANALAGEFREQGLAAEHARQLAADPMFIATSDWSLTSDSPVGNDEDKTVELTAHWKMNQ